jgi:hypothetical protein
VFLEMLEQAIMVVAIFIVLGLVLVAGLVVIPEIQLQQLALAAKGGNPHAGSQAKGRADLELHFMVKCAGLVCPDIENFRYFLKVSGFGNTGSPTSFSGSKFQPIVINVFESPSPDNPHPAAPYSISQRVPPTPSGLILTQRVSGDKDACEEGFADNILQGFIEDKQHKVCTIEYDYRRVVDQH